MSEILERGGMDDPPSWQELHRKVAEYEAVQKRVRELENGNAYMQAEFEQSKQVICNLERQINGMIEAAQERIMYSDILEAENTRLRAINANLKELIRLTRDPAPTERVEAQSGRG